MAKATVGVIGGSGLYEMKGLTGIERVRVRTPFGSIADALTLGKLEGVKVAFLARHGFGHRIMPSEINFRANIYALKSLGVKAVIAVTATGSLKEEIRPLDFVIVDQLFDRTYRRVGTFFGEGIVAHTSMAEPFCPCLRRLLVDACKRIEVRVHDGGTYVCIEGPQFSTRAESNVHRQLGFDVVGMTNVQEARLAREAEMCYATIACVTDYDVWREATEDVTIKEVIANLEKNVGNAMAVIRDVIPRIEDSRSCACREALKSAIITGHDYIPYESRKRLNLLIRKYL